jgi:hypothetical protein
VTIRANITSRSRPHTYLRSVALLLTVGSMSMLLAACGSNSDAFGNQACVHVEQSITWFKQSTETTGASAKALVTKASDALASALRPASLAASGDTNWQALAATLSESSRVTESQLVHALADECAASPSGPRGK